MVANRFVVLCVFPLTNHAGNPPQANRRSHLPGPWCKYQQSYICHQSLSDAQYHKPPPCKPCGRKRQSAFLSRLPYFVAILDNGNDVPELVRGVLNAHPQALQHVTDGKNLVQRSFHCSEFGTIGRGFVGPQLIAWKEDGRSPHKNDHPGHRIVSEKNQHLFNVLPLSPMRDSQPTRVDVTRYRSSDKGHRCTGTVSMF